MRFPKYPEGDPDGSRTWASVATMMKRRWPEKDEAEKLNLFTAWKFTYLRSRPDGFNIMAGCPDIELIAITMVWMRAVLFDQETIKIPDVIAEAKVTLDHFIAWENSDLGKYVQRLDSAIAKERMNGQTRKVLKKIVGWVEKDDKKAAEMFLRATGQYEGIDDPGKGIPIQVIEEYTAGKSTMAPAAKFYKQKLTPQEEAKLAVTAKFRGEQGKGVEVKRDIHTLVSQAELPKQSGGGVVWNSPHLAEAKKLHEEPGT